MKQKCDKQKTRTQSNVEFLEEIMTHSDYGALIQAYIIEALRGYSKIVLTHNPVHKDGFIHPEAWAGCAREVSSKINARYSA